MSSENKPWALLEESPVTIDGITLNLNAMTNGEKILLAKGMQDSEGWDDTMRMASKNISKVTFNGTEIVDPGEISDFLVKLKKFKQQNNVLENRIKISGLEDMKQKNSPSSSAP